MLEQAQESDTCFLAAFIGACIISRSTAGEQAILMFFGISWQLCALGPIQAIFLFSFPWVAAFLQTLHRRIKISRQESGMDDLAADGFNQIK
jgi:hypothetical protein